MPAVVQLPAGKVRTVRAATDVFLEIGEAPGLLWGSPW